MGSHYDTLGVSYSASPEEIKTAFRELSKKNHPDIAGSEHTKKYQEITHAASVLTNARQKEAYDVKLRINMISPASLFSESAPRPNQYSKRYVTPAGSYERILEEALRPRNLALGLMGMFALATLAKYSDPSDKEQADLQQQMMLQRKASQHLVQAWKNPSTGQWEQPAPWDPLYKRIKPKLELIPRDQVKLSKFR